MSGPLKKRRIREDGLTVFRPTAPSKLFWADRPAMRVVQALHWLRDALTDPDDRRRILRRLRAILADQNQGAIIAADLVKGLPTLPTWMQDIVRGLVADDADREEGGAASLLLPLRLT
jgi:hypothetical protein